MAVKHDRKPTVSSTFGVGLIKNLEADSLDDR